MALILMLPLSGRKNIVEWLESYRDKGMGLKQSAISFFDDGNNYTSTERKKLFNSKVEWVVNSIRNAGIPIKPTPKGRYSITAKMLSKVTPEDMDNDFKEWAFDDNIAGITFDNKKVVPQLKSLYKKGVLEDFDDLKIFTAFGKHLNIPAMEWLIDTYGVDTYKYEYTLVSSIMEVEYTSTSFVINEEILDLYIKKGIISKDNTSRAFPAPWKIAICDNKSIVEKLIPFIGYTEDLQDGSLPGELQALIPKYNDSLKKHINFTGDEWDRFVNGTINRITKDFNNWIDFLEFFMFNFDEFSDRMVLQTEWENYDKLMELLPEVRDIFLF